MNNLKRVLSLGLIGTMLSGMMVMGASAADFTDAEKIQHSEAVDVLNALEIIDGKPDGSFDPEGNVTRAEMAKMISVAMNGGRAANTGVKSTPTFTDIKGHWAESAIEYCSDLKIISGRGDGTFDPDSKVTGLEATKMVLTALGYDSQAYQLTGAAWAVQTDELARKASPSLYDELETIMMASDASRDTAAQLIWNGLQNKTRKVTPATNKNNGEVTWEYGEGKVMLTERYGAELWIGTYMGNADTGATSTKGEIKVGSANFPSDMSIDNIGEEVMVVFKDGKDSVVSHRPDKKDTIYGVFNTGKTQVVWTTANGIGDRKTTDVEIKADGEVYEAENFVDVTTNYATTVNYSAKNGNSNANSSLTGALKAQKADKIKLVFNDDNKIFHAYVTEVKAGQVTAVTASKVTINGIGTITLADNDVYEDVAKDDVVIFTRFYNDTDKDDAYFTVTKAESVEGELKGFKQDKYNNVANSFVNVNLDGTTYKLNDPKTAGNIIKLTDDGMDTIENKNIGDTVKVYLADGLVMGIDKVEGSGSNYAVVTDANTDGTLGSNLSGWHITVMTADGAENTYTVHKDSTKDGTTKYTDSDDIAVGSLIEYSLSGGKIKIKQAAEAVDIDEETLIWDESKRDVKFIEDNTGSTVATKVAASDAVAFVGVLDDDGTTVDKFHAYNLRALGDVTATENTKVAAFLNDDGDMVEALYYTNTKRPNGNTDTTLYGIVKSFDQYTKVGGENYRQYTISLSNGEKETVYVQDDDAVLAAGKLVIFDQTSDDCYDIKDFTILAGTDKVADLKGSTVGAAVAINSYNAGDRLLKYYEATSWNASNKIFDGDDAGSITVDKDIKVIYVNADDKVCDESGSVNKFDSDKGYANAVVYISDGDLVDVMFVETSGKKNLGGAAFASGHSENAISAIADVTSDDSSVTYSANVTDKAYEGDTVKVTVTRSAVPQGGTETVKLTSTKASVNETLTFDSNNKVIVSFTMPAVDVDDLTLTVSGWTAD